MRDLSETEIEKSFDIVRFVTAKIALSSKTYSYLKLKDNLINELYHTGKRNIRFRLTLVLSCAMKFESYPHDTQICSMMIESREYILIYKIYIILSMSWYTYKSL